MAADLYALVKELGGEVSAGGRVAVVPGPGHSKRDRSLSLRLSDDGERVIFYSHANDSCRDVMNYLGIEARHSDSLTSRFEQMRVRKLRAEAQRRQETADRLFCKFVWEGTAAALGSPVEAYLWSRGLSLDELDPDAVRFHPAAPRSKPKPEGETAPAPAPAMVALARDHEGTPKALHVTYVRPDGTGKAFGDASRLIFASPRGCAVRLHPIGADGVLAISEGIETGAAFGSLFGIPCWPALNTAGLKNFILPPRVQKLVIAADNDVNEAGLKAATELAERASRSCAVEVRMPPEPGDDWADYLIKRGAH